MDNNLNQEVLDKLTKTCVCKAITKAKIIQAIHNGANTVEKVAQETGATTGGCKGCRCIPKIQELLNTH